MRLDFFKGGVTIKILALDLSTKSSGWALFEGQTLKDYGCITSSAAALFTRIDKMTEELEKVMDKYNPDKVIAEEVVPEESQKNTVRRSKATFKALIYLQAFIAHMVNKKGKTLEFTVSSSWRKQCGIKTGAGIKRDSLKKADIAFVKEKYNIEVNDDIADAICIGYSIVEKENLVQKEKEAFTATSFDFK